MWKNDFTDEVFETREEAEESILDELSDYEAELCEIISTCDEEWIFNNLTLDAQEKILAQWAEKAIENNLFECDDE